MRFDFLTPQIFDMLIIANLMIACLLIVGRFVIDMRHKPESSDYREQHYDESSRSPLSETDLSAIE